MNNSSSLDFDKLLEDSPLIRSTTRRGVEGDVAFTVVSVHWFPTRSARVECGAERSGCACAPRVGNQAQERTCRSAPHHNV